LVTEPTASAMIQTDTTICDLNEMEAKIQELYTSVYVGHTRPKTVSCTFEIEEFRNDDNRVKYYTGLPNFKTLLTVFEFTYKFVKCGKSLTPFQELIIVLAKLRLNLGLQDIAYRCHISIATVSRIIRRWIITMDIRLVPCCIVWPDRDDLRKTMPLSFKHSFGSKVAVIIDCFEIFVDRPSNLMARTETWSQYKHHNTAKFLIGITPQGVVSFISKGWGGRVSDKYLTEKSGLLDKLLPGDIVLADRGFTIADSVAFVGASLHMPAFTKGRDQLTALEVEQSRSISNVRIHVERVIGLVRQKYSILGGPLPIDFISKTAEENEPLIDSMVRVCCCLSNLCDSVVPFS
jgi:hypothetical protein